MQQPARPSTAAQQPVFKATTTYVVIDVVATDKNGDFVKDLTADDFEISERSRPQTIANFDRVIVPVTTRSIDLHAATDPLLDVFDDSRR